MIGQRLANLALSKTYGQSIPAESPRLTTYDWDKEGQQFILYFDHFYDGLKIKEGQLSKGFTLQGYLEDGSVETILSPQNIIVDNDRITFFYSADFLPTHIKYAWAPAPENNIVNSAGLPLAPFRISLEGIN